MDYKVTDTREVSSMSPAGTQQRMYRVWLVTDKGATGTVDVSPDKWNEDELPGVLEAKAAELDLAFKVTG